MSQDAIYGEHYNSALQQQQFIQQGISVRENNAFTDDDECAQFAKEHLLDLVIIGRNTHQFYYVTHRGDILTLKAWIAKYKNVLQILEVDEKDGRTYRVWVPQGFSYHDKARIHGEREDYGRKPIYHRDYFTPTGFYDNTLGTFNIAKPCIPFAKETGRDTSHIYTYINAIAGDCALHLLAWLRMKLIDPTCKTQIVPIIISRVQGTGKSTFVKVLCKGLFGKDNVITTDQYDSKARFNADSVDKLVIGLEETDHEDARLSAAALKSRATNDEVRNEKKGQDPYYTKSFTEFVLTTNKDVPIKFDDREDQRRFMIMEADENFTRKKSSLADEVFTKLYGYDISQIKQGIPFVEDQELIAQLKHELYTREDIKNVEVRKFPHTAAYDRCFSLPRTSEATEIESIIRSLAPFIKASLENKALITNVTLYEGEPDEEVISLASFIQLPSAMQYFAPFQKDPAYVALCRPIVFMDQHQQKPFNHATVERSLYDCDPWLIEEYGIRVYPVTAPVPGGFRGINGRHKMAPSARFVLAGKPREYETNTIDTSYSEHGATRIGERLRVNKQWRPDSMGEYETVNEMKPGVSDLIKKTENVAYMDTFLFEADDTTKATFMIEEDRLKRHNNVYGRGKEINAEKLFYERLRVQRAEADRLFNDGIAARIVYSGGKSYHVLVRVADSPETVDEYKWLHAHLAIELSDKVTYDPTCSDPARLTRAPIMHERHFEYHDTEVVGQQRPISTNWNNVYTYNWRALYKQWLNRPLEAYESNGRKLIPTKPEYREAMVALLEGTFWTDAKWNGRRQTCFFPGYRLCRYLGYSHEQLWSTGGILDGLDSYYRKNEIAYWRSRETSEIISEIDKNMEEINDAISSQG